MAWFSVPSHAQDDVYLFSNTNQYQEDNLNAIVSKAKAAAAVSNMDEALSVLAEIPEEVSAYQDVVAPLILKFYQEQIDCTAENVLMKAQAAWSASPDEIGAGKAAEILRDFPEGSSIIDKAIELTNQMRKKVEYLDLREWNLKVKQIEQANAERMKIIDNAHEERTRQMDYTHAENNKQMDYTHAERTQQMDYTHAEKDKQMDYTHAENTQRLSNISAENRQRI